MDFTGSRALGHVLTRCEREHVAFGVARAGDHLLEMLRRSGLADRIGASHFYPSVDEAVTRVDGRSTVLPPEPGKRSLSLGSARPPIRPAPDGGPNRRGAVPRPATGRSAPRTRMWSIWLCGRQVGQLGPIDGPPPARHEHRTSGPQVFMSPASTASGRASARSRRRSSAQLRGEPKSRCDMWVPATEIGRPSTVRSTTMAARCTRSTRRRCRAARGWPRSGARAAPARRCPMSARLGLLPARQGLTPSPAGAGCRRSRAPGCRSA